MAATTETGPPRPVHPLDEEATRHDLTVLYERWFADVCRWLRAMGCPDRELEDLAQQVFLVARRKLPGFDGRSPAGWLYGIAWRVAADARRRAWFRRWLGSDLDTTRAPDSGDPVALLERREQRRVLYHLLDQMSARRRTVLMLAEVEGYSGAEIAELEGVKVATIWTRLHHARKDLLALVQRWERAEQRRGEPPR